jgi:hypothetical protein
MAVLAASNISTAAPAQSLNNLDAATEAMNMCAASPTFLGFGSLQQCYFSEYHQLYDGTPTNSYPKPPTAKPGAPIVDCTYGGPGCSRNGN